MPRRPVGVRWTIGDVSERGYEALKLSIWGAHRLFGEMAEYVVCINTVPVAEARARTEGIPDSVRWLEADTSLPPWIERHLSSDRAQGVAWKLAPLQVFRDRHELALDNDCILWALPEPMRAWLEDGTDAVLLAEDVRACFGQFSPLCGARPLNAGIRGLPPEFDLAQALRSLLEDHRVVLSSEVDEQGLQIAALSRALCMHVVPVSDVAICSPFPPHLAEVGRSGAHFCGVNVKRVPWEVDGTPGDRLLQAHWDRHRPELYRRVGLTPPATC